MEWRAEHRRAPVLLNYAGAAPKWNKKQIRDGGKIKVFGVSLFSRCGQVLWLGTKRRWISKQSSPG